MCGYSRDDHLYGARQRFRPVAIHGQCFHSGEFGCAAVDQARTECIGGASVAGRSNNYSHMVLGFRRLATRPDSARIIVWARGISLGAVCRDSRFVVRGQLMARWMRWRQRRRRPERPGNSRRHILVRSQRNLDEYDCASHPDAYGSIANRIKKALAPDREGTSRRESE